MDLLLFQVFLSMAGKFKIIKEKISKCFKTSDAIANEAKVKVLTSDLTAEQDKVQAANDERTALTETLNLTENKMRTATFQHSKLVTKYQQLYTVYFNLQKESAEGQANCSILRDEVTALKYQARINEETMTVLSNNLNAEKAKVRAGKKQISILNASKVDLEHELVQEQQSYCHLVRKYTNEQTNHLKTVAENARLQEDTECSVCCEPFDDAHHSICCFKGCGHIVCFQCARTIVTSQRLCHQCRARVPQVNKILRLYK